MWIGCLAQVSFRFILFLRLMSAKCLCLMVLQLLLSSKRFSDNAAKHKRHILCLTLPWIPVRGLYCGSMYVYITWQLVVDVRISIIWLGPLTDWCIQFAFHHRSSRPQQTPGINHRLRKKCFRRGYIFQETRHYRAPAAIPKRMTVKKETTIKFSWSG